MAFIMRQLGLIFILNFGFALSAQAVSFQTRTIKTDKQTYELQESGTFVVRLRANQNVSNTIVQMEIRKKGDWSSAGLILDKRFHRQNFRQNRNRRFRTKFQIPQNASAGDYTLHVQVWNANWSNIYQNHSNVTFEVVTNTPEPVPTPTPVPQPTPELGFSIENERTDKATYQRSEPVTFSVAITANQKVNGRIVQMEVRKKNDWTNEGRILDKHFQGVNFEANIAKTMTTQFSIPSNAPLGNYTLHIQVYDSQWGNQAKKHSQVGFELLDTTTGPTPTPIPTPTPTPTPGETSPYVPAGYQLTFADEFDSLNLDASGEGKGWGTYFIGWNTQFLAGNSDKAFKTTADNTGRGTEPLNLPLHQLNNGVLKLQAMPIPDRLKNAFWDFPHAGGMITSQNMFDQQYGYWEIRMAAKSVTKGQHWAVWLLPSDNSWPPEIDILEVAADPNFSQSDTSCFTANSHHAGNGAANLRAPASSLEPCNFMNGSYFYGDQTFYRAPAGGKAFHTFGFEWTATKMITYIDGVKVREQDNYVNKPMYLLITPETTNNWTGPEDSTTKWPSEFDIDYIRVYKK